MAEEEKKDQTPPAEGAPAEAGSPEEAAALAKAKKRKMLMIGGGAVAVVGLLIAVAVFMLGGKKEPEHDETAAAALVIYDVPQMNVNLLGETGQTFLRTKLALELKKAEDIPAAEKLLPRLQDDWQGFLRQMRVEDFRGSASVDRVKNALLLRARQVMAPLPVNNVLVREILVQ